MARGENQKRKLLYLADIFYHETDENNKISTNELIEKLAKKNINAERKSIYSDLQELRDYGLDIISSSGRGSKHYLASRDFELAEVRMLVDSIQMAKFITEKKSLNLIGKLEKLVSDHEAKELHRNVSVFGRVKTRNEKIYYNVDKIQEAMNEDKKIEFHYWQWNEKKEMELRHNGDLYLVSPMDLICGDDNYYLVGYDGKDGRLKNYRVDKMEDIQMTDAIREGKQEYLHKDRTKYSKSMFGMFPGETKKVTLLCDKKKIGIMIDRFGYDIMITPINEEFVQINVDVVPSPHFYAWIIGLGTGIKITHPDSAVEGMKEILANISKIYNKS